MIIFKPKYFIIYMCFVCALDLCGCSRPVTLLQPADSLNISDNAVNINTATEQELERLPHIGPKLAQTIIDFRNAHGPFRKSEHLLLIRGFSDNRYREIRSLIKTQ